jgi:hypothetical protein
MNKHALALLFLAASLPTAHALIEIEGYYWNMTPEGDLSVGFGSIAGTVVDLEDDLGYDAAEDVFGVSIVAGELVQLGASYFALDLSAGNTVDRRIRFEDVVFNPNAEVSSKLEATFIRGFVRLDVGIEEVHGGVMAGGLYIDLEAEASAERFGTGKADARTGMPFIGAFVYLRPFEYLQLKGSVSGGDWELEDVQATFLDAEASVQFRAPTGFFAGVGYRHIDIEAEDDDERIEADVTLSGPTAYVGFDW